MRREFTTDDGTRARWYSLERAYIPDRANPERFPGHYTAKHMRGVAWVILGAEIAPTVTVWEDDNGCEVEFSEWKETGRVVARMVGDDRPEAFDLTDLERLEESDFCHVCGQVGCCHDGYDRGD